MTCSECNNDIKERFLNWLKPSSRHKITELAYNKSPQVVETEQQVNKLARKATHQKRID